MFISCVERGEPSSPSIITRVSSHQNSYIAIAYHQEMWQPLVRFGQKSRFCNFDCWTTRLSPSAAGAICEFFSQSAWVVGSHRSIHRTSWVHRSRLCFPVWILRGFHKSIHDFESFCPKVQASCHATVPIPPAVRQCPEIYIHICWSLVFAMWVSCTFLVPSNFRIIFLLSWWGVPPNLLQK